MGLRDAEVLVVDCQATGASPTHGVAMELGWGRACAADGGVLRDAVVARLLRLPAGVIVPPAVTRVTGLRTADLRAGAEPLAAWADLSELASSVAHALTATRAPAVVHFARFEEGFLRELHAAASPDADFPLDFVCTHEIARRLMPALPRRGLRALTGYFGHAVGPLRRSADHVTATAFVWSHLVEALAAQGVWTFADLAAWLAQPAAPRPRRKAYPMPRPLRLSLPECPGVYRMLRVGGDVLYVGKATVLRDRVNSYFRKQRGVHERALEMLAQARDLSWTTTDTALEAALLETDEIKRLRPPYNVALLEGHRSLWFATRDLTSRAPAPDDRHRTGPFPSRDPLDAFALLAAVLDDPLRALDARQRGLLVGAPPRWAPSAEDLSGGLERLVRDHPRLLDRSTAPQRRLIALGTASWERFRTAVDDDDEPEPTVPEAAWDDAKVAKELETLAVRTAHNLRRAGWLTRLSESTICFHEPSALPDGAVRMLAIEHGEIVDRATRPAGADTAVPAGFGRPGIERRAALTVAAFDRLRVLTTELRRVAAIADGGVQVRLGPGPALRGASLARVLWWL